MSAISRLSPLPAFELPLAVRSRRKGDTAFPNAMGPFMDRRNWRARLPPLTLQEIEMTEFINKITDERGWEHKVFDDTSSLKWKSELLRIYRARLTEEMADNCIEELKHKAELYTQTGFLQVYSGNVIKSDVAVPIELQSAFRTAVAPLENVPGHKQAWRPGSDEKVLDLVDPSLFPFVFGQSYILTGETASLDDCISRYGQGGVIPEPSLSRESCWIRQEVHRLYSTKFQWLPCDVDISGDSPKIVSYINNLHPEDNRDLYSAIEKIVGKVIPLWNATLPTLPDLNSIEGDIVGPGDLYIYAYDDRLNRFYARESYDFELHSEPYDLERPEEHVIENQEEPVDLKASYGGTGLQVIVQLTNIHLTPEKPEYEGDPWRSEGRLNEHICATAIYCYDSENITPNHIAFRQPSDITKLEEEGGREVTDMGLVENVFGLRRHEPAVQVVGSIEVRQGRVITFSNILQRQVQPFKLADPTKPGHQKILVLFLVDPNIKIILAANVPCQQHDWRAREVASVLAKLPIELSDKIVEELVDFPIGAEHAKWLREEMTAEREAFADSQNGRFNYVTVHLPNH